eukprot:scaffold250252_cov33-Tisochrysis_lutea.AAC.3
MAALKKLDSMRAVSSNSAKPPVKPVAQISKKESEVPNPSARTKDGDWICRSCTKRNDAETDGDCTVSGSFKFCPSCGESDVGVPSRKPAPTVSDQWDCHCGEICPPSFKFCVECGLAAGTPKPPPAGVCGGCDEAMPESWKFCPDCGTEAGEWDSEAMARMAKLPPSDGADWHCTNCNGDIPGYRFCPECGTTRGA